MRIRRPFRAAVYVAVIALAVGYVVFSAWRLPAFIDTPVAIATSPLFGRDRELLAGIRWWDVLAIRTAEGWSVRPFRTSWFETPELASAVYARRAMGFAEHGVWHAVVETRTDEVRFTINGYLEPFTNEHDRAAILRALNAREGYEVTPDHLVAEYASGPIVTHSVLWLGVLGDLSILAAFGAIVFCLVKLRREIRWRKPGCCAECDYDLAALNVEKCPECGAVIKSRSCIG